MIRYEMEEFLFDNGIKTTIKIKFTYTRIYTYMQWRTQWGEVKGL
jgi:hypothetical protein